MLTLGFARRFTDYKRPNLLLARSRIAWRRLLDLASTGPSRSSSPARRIRDDEEGKRLLQSWARVRAAARGAAAASCSSRTTTSSLAQELVQGVDVWINTPRRPWEACGTSGMKVLVNGGLNLSELDGWWAEAYEPDVGLGARRRRGRRPGDDADAEQLYGLLEQEIVPEFYARDARGHSARVGAADPRQHGAA